MISAHDLVIEDEVNRLKKIGYQCQREYTIPIAKGKRRGQRITVDIRAVRDREELLIEVGSLSNSHGKRLELLKSLHPDAKIIHITQIRYFINSFDILHENTKWFLAKNKTELTKELSERTW